MPGELHEISAAIGGLEANMKNVLDAAVVINAKLDHASELVIKSQLAADAANKRLDLIEPQVKDHEMYKNKQLGIIAFVTFVMGLAGAALWKVIVHAI